jgi:N-acetylmuramoyl-L-alanine amidase CwlA
MKINHNIVPKEKYSIKCPYSMEPEYITIHNTANDASAANEIAYMIRNDNKVSFHFSVDDVQALQGILLNRNAWHAGDGRNGTGNRKSIGIEICYSKSGGAKYNKAVKNAIELTARLMKQYDIPASKIMYHQNWDQKYCPHSLLDDGISIDAFRTAAQLKYDELYKGGSDMKLDNTPADWAKEAVNWAVKEGILKGDANGNYGLHDTITVERFLVFLHRAITK